MEWFAALDRDGSVLHDRLPALVAALDWTSGLIELVALGVILVGTVRFLAGFLRAEILASGPQRVQSMNAARASLGRYILAGLEVFIVADVIRVAISLEFSALVYLGVLVVIRTLISFALDRELIEIRRDME